MLIYRPDLDNVSAQEMRAYFEVALIGLDMDISSQMKKQEGMFQHLVFKYCRDNEQYCSTQGNC
jgi:hypothetical protein